MTGTERPFPASTWWLTMVLLLSVCQWAPRAVAAPQLPESTDEEARLLLAEARRLVEEGRATDALPFYAQSLDMAEARLDPHSPILALLLHELGGVQLQAGHAEQAEIELRRALGILEAAFGSGHRELLPVLADLASLLASDGRAAAAEIFYRRTLDLLERERQPGDPEIVRALGQLALLADEQGREDEAETLYRRSVSLAAEAGEESPELASTLNNLASLYHRRGQWTEAESLYRRALDIRQRLLGPNHWLVAVSQSDLALVLGRQGRLADALDQATRAAAILSPYCSGLTAEATGERRSARELCRDTETLRGQLRQRLAGERASEAARVAQSTPTASAEPDPQPVRTRPGAVVYRAQVASRGDGAAAEAEGREILARHSALLHDQALHIETVDLGQKGQWHRIQFGAFASPQSARQLCRALLDRGLTECLVAAVEP